MTKDLLTRYSTLKAQIKALEAEVEEIKPTIVSEMESEAMDEVLLPNVGKLYFKERRIWTYPEVIDTLEKQLKADKKVAQQKGTATCEIARDLTFRGLDENTKDE